MPLTSVNLWTFIVQTAIVLGDSDFLLFKKEDIGVSNYIGLWTFYIEFTLFSSSLSNGTFLGPNKKQRNLGNTCMCITRSI